MRVFIYILLFLQLNLVAQIEYATNGSFEQIDSCYGCIADLGQDVFTLSGCEGWSNPIKSSSDLWCTNGKVCTLQPPNVGLGYQYPQHENNMAAFLVSDPHVLNYREYIQNKLITTLKINYTYEISFHASSNLSICSISEIGIKFFNTKYSDNNKLWLTEFKPDCVNDTANFITDSLGWQKISIKYKANGTENYAVIGCFADSVNIKYTMSNCDTTFWNGGNYTIDYIFFDNLSITEIPIDANIPNVFTPNNDGVNDVFKIQVVNINNWNCKIYNRWGNIITELNESKNEWKADNESSGTYYYIFSTPENEINKKGFISLFNNK